MQCGRAHNGGGLTAVVSVRLCVAVLDAPLHGVVSRSRLVVGSEDHRVGHHGLAEAKTRLLVHLWRAVVAVDKIVLEHGVVIDP
jgi:hypothetical protein